MTNWLIAGLGNPGLKYERTRHNVGFWWLKQLSKDLETTFAVENKFHGRLAHAQLSGHKLFLLQPQKFMNCSGQAIAAILRFYKINLNNILVVHDDLHLPVGKSRLKRGGGHSGHNGVRNIIAKINTSHFLRCRLGIARPVKSQQVSDYVLSKPSQIDELLILGAINNSINILSDLLSDNLEQAMYWLHLQ